MRWSLGRLMPTGVTGPLSPVSQTTSMLRAEMPRTRGLRNCASYGMRSSNHCAESARPLMSAAFFGSS
jgi:hypothetical protein